MPKGGSSKGQRCDCSWMAEMDNGKESEVRRGLRSEGFFGHPWLSRRICINIYIHSYVLNGFHNADGCTCSCWHIRVRRPELSTRCASKPTAAEFLDAIRILTVNLLKRVRKPVESHLSLLQPSVCLYEWSNSRTDKRILITFDTWEL